MNSKVTYQSRHDGCHSCSLTEKKARLGLREMPPSVKDFLAALT